MLSIGVAFLCDFKHIVKTYFWKNIKNDLFKKMFNKTLKTHINNGFGWLGVSKNASPRRELPESWFKIDFGFNEPRVMKVSFEHVRSSVVVVVVRRRPSVV